MNDLQQEVFSPGIDNSLVGQADRRREPRTQSARPVYVRAADPTASDFEEVRTITNFSRTGFYFITARVESYRPGMKLYVIPALGCFNFEFLGEVVRIEPLAFGEYGIAVQLLRIGRPAVNATMTATSLYKSYVNISEENSKP
jgi:hypothetical protein